MWRRRGSSPGPGVDEAGRPVVDPTENVIALVQAGLARQDDLRAADAVLAELRARYEERIDRLRSEHGREIRLAEAARIDAIRAVDVAAVTRAAEVAAAQATTLAAQVVASAEAMRTQVNAAAIAAATALATALEPHTKAIENLREQQYRQQGQQTQKTEGRDTGQWLVTVVVGVAAIIVTWIAAHGSTFVTAVPAATGR
jgi:hypothetical protein